MFAQDTSARRWHICAFIILAFALTLMSACVPARGQAHAANGTTRVLFVGNSFTKSSIGDSTAMFESLSLAHGKKVEIDKVIHNGARLADFAFDSDQSGKWHDLLVRKLTAQTWDYVICQEASKTSVQSPLLEMHCSAREIRQLIAEYQPHAEMLLYMTPGYDNGATFRIDGKARKLSASDLQLYTQAAYEQVGDMLGLRVIPAGMYYHKHVTGHPGDALIGSDDKHPTAAGYFLSACAFYESLFGEAPRTATPAIGNPGTTLQARLMSTIGGTTTFAPARIALSEGEVASVSFSSDDPFLIYGTIDPTIATVGTDKTLTARKEGRTVAYVESSSGARATCSVSVESPELMERGLMFPSSSSVMDIGKTSAAKLLVSASLGDYRLTWSSSDPAVASVDAWGTVTALKPGKAKIMARDSMSGKQAACNVFVKLAEPQVSKVKKVRYRSKSTTKFALEVSWGKVRGATMYKVYRRTKPSGSFKLVATTKRTSFTDEAVKANKLARYRIVAANDYAKCASNRSSILKGIVLSQPSLTAKATSGGIRLSWSENEVADGYEVYRAAGKSGAYKLVKTIGDCYITAWRDKSAQAGKTYRYKVRSFRDCDNGMFTSDKSAAKSAKIPKARSLRTASLTAAR